MTIGNIAFTKYQEKIGLNMILSEARDSECKYMIYFSSFNDLDIYNIIETITG